MIFPIAMLALASTSDIDMLFNARFYKQGSAKSTYQIFVANHTGAHRRQISTGNHQCDAPMWVDRNHIAYVETVSISKTTDIEDSDTCKAHVILVDLRTGRSQSLGNLPSNTQADDVRSKGNRFSSSLRLAKGSRKNLIYTVTLHGFTRKEGYFHDEDWFGMPTEKNADQYDLKAPRKATVAKKWSLTWTPEQKETDSDKMAEIVAEYSIKLKSQWKGKTSNFKLHGDRVEKAFIATDGTGILMTSLTLEKEYHESYLYRFDKGFGKCQLVCHNVGYLILNEDQPLWHAYQTYQGPYFMQGLKDGRAVYATWLYTGNWKTGRQCTVLEGLVSTGAVRFRPLK